MSKPVSAKTDIDTPLAIPNFKLDPAPNPTKICSIADLFGIYFEIISDN